MTTADVIETLKTQMEEAVTAAVEAAETSLTEKDEEIEALKEKIGQLQDAMLTAVAAAKDAIAAMKAELAKETADGDEIETQVEWLTGSIDDLETAAKDE